MCIPMYEELCVIVLLPILLQLVLGKNPGQPHLEPAHP